MSDVFGSNALRPEGPGILLALDTETTGIDYGSVPVGVSWSTGVNHGYLAWGHLWGGNNATRDNTRQWLKRLGRDDTVVFHNAAFDLRMLANIGVDLVDQGVKILDTGFMAAVHNELEPVFSLGALAEKYLGSTKSDEALNQWCAEKFGGRPTRKGQAKNYWRAPANVVAPYAIDDAKLTYYLHAYYRRVMTDPEDLEVLRIEHALIPVLHRMYRNGVRVDYAGAEALARRLELEIADIKREWDRVSGGVPLAGEGSRKGLMELWTAHGLPVSRTPKGAPSITKEILAEVDHPIAHTLSAFREREKILGTFVKGYFLEGAIAHPSEYRIHPTFYPLRTTYGGTVSGRFSSSNPNLQNLPSPSRDDKETADESQWGTVVRRLVLPERGAQWVKLDYSQIEYRFFGHYAGGQIRDAYNSDPNTDFHNFCTRVAFGIDEDHISWKEKRSEAKNGNFAKLYGAGINRLARTLGVSVPEAKRFMTEYDAKIPEAAQLYQKVMAVAGQRGWIRTWGGRKRRFKRSGRRFTGTHAALNALLQGSNADLIKRAMIEIDRELVGGTSDVVMHLTVHDELDFSAPRGLEGDRFIRRCKELMEDYQLTVPIKADAEVGPNWGQLKDWKP